MKNWPYFTALIAIACGLMTTASGPSIEVARQYGPEIFSAVHNAMRQWGSSINHNGMSFFPAIIPKGTILYHGGPSKDIPNNFEWLAFEIDHAESFARRRRRPNGIRRPKSLLQSRENAQCPLIAASQVGDARGPERGGNLHIYQATRQLSLLYIDGMAAADTNLGTLDSGDFILSNNRSRPVFDEWQRAHDLCQLGRQWGFDGAIRMEPGFEVVYCNFTNGLKLLSALEQPGKNSVAKITNPNEVRLEWLRGASQRYKGIGGGRVVLDYSSMVSAFFYPLNLTNPNFMKRELPRLIYTTPDELKLIKEHLATVFRRSDRPVIDWQGVTDMIVSRFSDKLRMLTEKIDSLPAMQSLVSNMVNLYIDYSEEDATGEAVTRCTRHYLLPVTPLTPEDHLIHAGISSTMSLICTALFQARKLVVEAPSPDHSSLEQAKVVVRQMMDILRWSEWQECGHCQPDEICMIAMWPFGSAEDHYHPTCKNASGTRGKNDYWSLLDGF